jgi:hypothetical protein
MHLLTVLRELSDEYLGIRVSWFSQLSIQGCQKHILSAEISKWGEKFIMIEVETKLAWLIDKTYR